MVLNPTQTEPQDMSNKVDSDNRSSTINIPNFLALMSHKMKVKGTNSKDAIKGAFKLEIFDMDSNSFMLVTKFGNVIANLG
eukprot:scaffold12956_cov71-Cyclotella_meneghiniana.AAC.10